MVHPTPTWLNEHQIKKGQRLSPETEFKKGSKPPCTGSKERQLKSVCETCGKEFIHYRYRKGRFCSIVCKAKGQSGPKNQNWKGGFKNTEAWKSRINLLRQSYKWRMKVLVRDNFICRTCGADDSFDAHHIKSWKDFPEARLDVQNGITLCKLCHNRTKGKNFIK